MYLVCGQFRIVSVSPRINGKPKKAEFAIKYLYLQLMALGKGFLNLNTEFEHEKNLLSMYTNMTGTPF